jgi:hypothetical protein
MKDEVQDTSRGGLPMCIRIIMRRAGLYICAMARERQRQFW